MTPQKQLSLPEVEQEARSQERPLEGLSGDGSGTTWTFDADELASAEVYGHDEEDARNEAEQRTRT